MIYLGIENSVLGGVGVKTYFFKLLLKSPGCVKPFLSFEPPMADGGSQSAWSAKP